MLAFHLAHGGFRADLISPAVQQFPDRDLETSRLPEEYAGVNLAHGTHIYLWSWVYPPSMVDGDDQQTLSQSIKGRLQEGVQNSVFRDRGLLDPDAVIDEDRIVGRDKQLDDIITYLRPALQGNRPPNMLLYGPSGTGKSLIINAVCQQVVEL